MDKFSKDRFKRDRITAICAVIDYNIAEWNIDGVVNIELRTGSWELVSELLKDAIMTMSSEKD